MEKWLNGKIGKVKQIKQNWLNRKNQLNRKING